MRFDFDPKKNMTKLDYVLMQGNRAIDTARFYFDGFLSTKRIVKNWPEVFFFRLGLKKAITMKLRSGSIVKINKPEDYSNFWVEQGPMALLSKQVNSGRKIKIDGHKKTIKFNTMQRSVSLAYDSNKQLLNTFGLITEQFIEEQYKWLDVKGKDVIDIGASVGDTAIYFALNGARHVYAFEPYSYSYKLALKNIKLNGLQNKITLLNEGCGGKECSISIDINYQNTVSTELKEFNKGKEIKVITLRSIIKRFDIRDSAILKVDCEGCEYGTLLKSQNSDLRKFQQIQFEYHYGYLNLKKKLEEAGFIVKKTCPGYSLNKDVENKEMFTGLIYAERGHEHLTTV